MVSSIGVQLNSRKPITGFGRKTGRGVVRKTVGAIARPALTYIANKLSDLISGEGKKRVYKRKTTAGSYKITGMGGRKPRSSLKRKTGGRKPRTTLRRRLLF